MAQGKAKLFVDHLSQPSRALMIFCRMAGLGMEEVLVNIGRGETKTPAYRAVNKLGKVPCLQEPDGYTVCESATIFRYLCNTRSTSVPDHWYPAAPRARAPVDAALDWSLGTLRPTTALTVFNRVIAPLRGTAGNSVLVEQHSLPAMKTALEALEGQFLADGKYVAGEDISLADLQIACELEQLCLLDGAKEGPTSVELLSEFPKTRQWLQQVADRCEPHYGEVHGMLRKMRQNLLRQKERQQAKL